MHNTITLSQLITRVAKLTGVDNNTARRFLRAFFAGIAANLEQGQSVTIKNIGTFRRNTDFTLADRGPVTFIPAPELSGEINKPFEMFEPVELAPDADFSELDKALENADEVSAVSKDGEDNPVSEDVPGEDAGSVSITDDTYIPEPTVPEPVETVTVEMEVPQEPKVVETPIDTPVQETVLPASSPVVNTIPATAVQESIPEPVPEPQAKPETVMQKDVIAAPAQSHYAAPEANRITVDPVDYHYKHPKRNPIWLWVVIILIVFGVGAYLAAVFLNPIPDYDEIEGDISELYPTQVEEVNVEEVASVNPDNNTVSESHEASPAQTQTTQTAAPAPEQAQPQAAAPATVAKSLEPVYDTVDVSLIRLARKHYGQHLYWVYIFEANQDIIKDPNKIRPGTRVRIPDVSELPGATQEETRNLAKKKQTEIQNKFK